MPTKLWLVRDKEEVYALCGLCVMYRHLGLFVDHAAADEELSGVVAAQGGVCRAEIEDYPCCRSIPEQRDGPRGGEETQPP
jgi:hypothetical protein